MYADERGRHAGEFLLYSGRYLFVAQGLGTQGLAALNLTIPAYNFIYGTGLLLGMGGATRYAVCKSRGDARGADTAFTHALYLAALCAAAGAALGASG
ncbi:MAG: hypothetical protein DBY17_04560 [Oscillospiraceae bacterium]|nr:MAG: hypothetical protein DBY17_04560 [Oscillospiraceae bacterium]